jgi:hypothetical protein
MTSEGEAPQQKRVRFLDFAAIAEATAFQLTDQVAKKGLGRTRTRLDRLGERDSGIR